MTTLAAALLITAGWTLALVVAGLAMGERL